MALEHLGLPLTGTYPITGGDARLFERGAIITGTAGEVELTFDLPMIGNPRIAPKREMQRTIRNARNAPRRVPVRDPNDPRNPRNPNMGGLDLGAWALSELAVTFTPGAWDLSALHESIKSAFADRLALLPTGQASTPVAIEFLAPKEVVSGAAGNTARYGLPTMASLASRQLYDVAVRDDNGQWTVIAPHAIYYRETWTDFGIAHVTDTHIARRIDSFHDRLIARNRAAGAEAMYNFNDRFRGFIRYANQLHSENRLDVILVTGDFIDYLFEDNDDPNGGGNALFARELLLGKRPASTFPDVEELRVPIFLVPGNHDYRTNPYYLLFKVDGGLFNLKEVKNFSPYNIGWWEGLALSAAGSEPIRGVNTPSGLRLTGPDVPELGRDTAAKMVEIDQENRPFKTHLVDEGSYVINLGDRHRIVMVDSAWDEGVVTGLVDAFEQLIGQGSEDEDAFVGGCPNSHGITDQQLAMVTNTLNSANGLVIVGMHAPLLNPQGNTYAYFMRETQRAALRGNVEHFLDSFDPPLPGDMRSARDRHRTWWPETGNAEPAYVKRGDVDDLLDWGVSRGRAYELLRAIAGDGTSRAADIVLQGHTHRHNEFRIGRDGGQLAYFMDFYTQTPRAYYPTRFPTEYNPISRRWSTEVTYVNVTDSAPPNGRPAPVRSGAYKYSVDVPPYANPLSTAADPTQWWADHRPLLLQTGALGPIENDQVSFSGFRVLTVKKDVIDKIHFIPMQRLHENGYRLPWDEAIK